MTEILALRLRSGETFTVVPHVAPEMLVLAVSFALLGIALGTPAGDLRSTLGDPLVVESSSKLSHTAAYLRADDPSAVLRVTEREGVVFAVEIERERAEATLSPADHHGIAVGMTHAELLAKRGKAAFETMNTALYPEDRNETASTIYRFDGDIIESIKLVGSGVSAAGNGSLPQLAEGAGDSYASAILDLTPTVLGSDHFRDRYLTVHGCDTSGRRSTIDRRDGLTFAVINATCAGRSRTWYFDITRAKP